jgi:hypothetical protein
MSQDLGERGPATRGRRYVGSETLRLTRAREVLVLPAAEPLDLEGYVITGGPDFELERAGVCAGPRGENAHPDSAYLTPVYISDSYAREALSAHAQDFSKRVLPNRPRSLTQDDPLEFAISRIKISGLRGRDYRERPCGLRNALAELRDGSGNEAAWREVTRQREADEIEGLLLARSYGTVAQLFLFLAARGRIDVLEEVEKRSWSYQEVHSDGVLT